MWICADVHAAGRGDGPALGNPADATLIYLFVTWPFKKKSKISLQGPIVTR